MKSFNNRNFLIFAGTSSIAQDLIKKLKIFNSNVIFTSRNEQIAANIKQETNYDYHICQDLSNFDDVEQITKIAQEKLGKIDGIVNFAGSIMLKSAHQTNFEQYMNVINSNLTTCFSIVRAASKNMSQGGSVVFISSIAASIGISNHEAIAAAKSGIEGLVRSAACTYSAKNIRFNAIAPSLTRTNLSKDLTNNEIMLKASNSMHALGRIGEVSDISRACSFLLNPDNDWITGQIIKIDGGFSLKAKPKT